MGDQVVSDQPLRDLSLTAMNREFMFQLNKKKSDVIAGLDKNKDYTFVPILDSSGSGALVDVIHSRVFWDGRFAGDEEISAIIQKLDSEANLKDLRELHGDSFFVKVHSNDKVAEVLESMNKRAISVGIERDEKESPTRCFTKTELRSLLGSR
jgi:hypothetical protein